MRLKNSTQPRQPISEVERNFLQSCLSAPADAPLKGVRLKQQGGEVLLANRHVALRIDPGRGGRVMSLCLAGHDLDLTLRPPSGSPYGGLALDITSGMNHPMVCVTAPYEWSRHEVDEGAIVVRCEHLLGEGPSRGLTLRKDYCLGPADRACRLTVIWRNDGVTPIRLDYRSHNMLRSEPRGQTQWLLPTERGLMRRANNNGWKVTDLAAGWIAGVSPENGPGLVCQFDPSLVCCACSWLGKNEATAEWCYQTRVLSPGEQWATNIQYLPFIGLSSLNVVHADWLGYLSRKLTRERFEVELEALGLTNRTVSVQPVLFDNYAREVGRFPVRMLPLTTGAVNRVEWHGEDPPAAASWVRIMVDGQALAMPPVAVGENPWESQIVPQPFSEPFKAFVADRLTRTEARCVVPEQIAEWKAKEAEIRHGLKWIMSEDLARVWPELHPECAGVVPRRGYRIEQVAAEFWPGVRYGMHVFVPDGPGPFPAVIVVGTGPSGGRGLELQRIEITLAELGILAVGITPLGKGVCGTEKDAYDYNEIAMLVGTSIRQEQEHTALRTLEYLLTRPDVNPAQIAITGGSCAGLTSLMTSTLDPRITAMAPFVSTWTYSHFLLPELWQTLKAEEGNSPGLLTFGANVPTLAACNAPKWQRFLYSAYETDRLDVIPIIDRAAVTAYRLAGEPGRFSSTTCDCKHGDYPEFQADIINWVHRIFFGKPPVRRVTAGPKRPADWAHGLLTQSILLDGQPVKVVGEGTAEYERLKFPDFDEDGGRKAFLPIIAERQTAARAHRARLVDQPERLRDGLLRSLGLVGMELAPFASGDGGEIRLRTEGELEIRAEWVRRATEASGSVTLVVGNRESQLRYRDGGSARLDLEMREQNALSHELTVLVVLNRPPLGMWVWDSLNAARWLRQMGYREVELVGVGEAGRIIALLAGLLSDEVTHVSLAGAGIKSLDEDVVGRQALTTRYWTYRLLWVTDLPEAAETLRRMGRLRENNEPPAK